MGLGDSLRRRREGPKPSTRKPAEKPDRPARTTRRKRSGSRPAWLTWLIAAVVVLGGSFLVGYLLSTQLLFPRPETAGTGIAVPALYGEARTDAEAAVREAGLEIGQVRELASTHVDRGRVLAQDPIPGQQLRRGAAVSFAVSAGPPALRVPPVRGLGVGTARELLESVGFQVELQQTRTGELAEGLVVRAEPESGTERALPAVVTLVVSAGVPVDTLPSEPTDSGPVGPAPEPGSETPTETPTGTPTGTAGPGASGAQTLPVPGAGR